MRFHLDTLLDISGTIQACRQSHLFGNHVVHYTLHGRIHEEPSLSELTALCLTRVIHPNLIHSVPSHPGVVTGWSRLGYPEMRHVSCTLHIFNIQLAIIGHCGRFFGFTSHVQQRLHSGIFAAFRPGELADGVLVLITCDGGFSLRPALSALDSAEFWLVVCISNIYCTIHTLLEVYEPHWA
jgi:hypothetical protein